MVGWVRRLRLPVGRAATPIEGAGFVLLSLADF